MGIAEGYVAATKGWWDAFDRCNAIADLIEKHIDPDDEEVIEFHPGEENELFGYEVEPHFKPKNERIRENLAEAKRLVDQACLLCQEALAEI